MKPLIDCKYRTNSTETYMAGISVGGLISTYAACMYPDVFKRVAAISSGFYRNQEEIEALVASSDLSSMEKFYFDCGTKEGGSQFIHQEFLASNQAVYQLLREKVYVCRFNVIEGAAHNYGEFKKRVPDIIGFLTSP